MPTLLFLGTGGSMGVPVIGCGCEVCRSDSPYNKRLRSSVLLSIHHKKILIDAAPDLREQALKHHITQLDGVILTHSHHDHTAGIDDLRVYYLSSQLSVPCLLSEETAKDIRNRFDYMFKVQPSEDSPRLQLQILPGDRGEMEFLGIPLKYMSYEQLNMKVAGLRFGKLAYITDIKKFPATLYDDLKGVETLIVSALRYTPSHMHFNIDEAVDFAIKVGAKNTWLTHLAHELDYFKANTYLPPNVRMAYDGLQINFEM